LIIFLLYNFELVSLVLGYCIGVGLSLK